MTIPCSVPSGTSFANADESSAFPKAPSAA